MKKVIIIIGFIAIVGVILGSIFKKNGLTEEQIRKITSDAYKVKENKIFSWNNEIKGVDVNTFEPLGYNYSKDKKNVYLFANKIEDVDPSSFEILPYDYSKDENHVHYKGKIIPEADPKTFHFPKNVKYIHLSPYAFDDKFVYTNGKKLDGANSKTFEFIEADLGRDKSVLYYSSEKVDGVDASTLQFPSYNYAKDANTIFYRGNGGWEPMKIEINSYKFLSDYYIKDDNFVYYKNKMIKEADPRTFSSINNDFGKDKNAMYYRDFKLYKSVNPNSDHPFKGNYELTGFIDTVNWKCQEDCMGYPPYDIEYVFFQVIDADDKNIFAVLQDGGPMFIRDKRLGLGCLNRRSSIIYSVNQIIKGKDFLTLLQSSKEEPVRLKVSSNDSSNKEDGLPLCYSFYKNFKILK